MDTFNDQELTPDQLKFLTLQFLGQNLGELKELDKNIISKNNTLQGFSIDPHAVLNSISAPPTAPVSTPTQPATLTPIEAQPQPAVIITPQSVATQLPEKDENQLELDFTTSATIDKLFDRLERVERKIDKILDNIAASKQPT